MMLSLRRKGAEVESLAAKFLQQRGLDIVERNYHCRGGEIDIIARDRDTLVFIEVRYRENPAFGNAAESVTPRKQQRLILAARHYLHRHHIDQACRFDVIGFDGKNSPQWVQNAFQT